VWEGHSQVLGKPKKTLLVTTQRSKCWHLQRVTHNKANECLTTNWDSALDPKKAPKTKKNTRNRSKKNTQTWEEKELFKPVKH